MPGTELTSSGAAPVTGEGNEKRPGIPLVVYLLGLAIFMLTTSEFMVGGMIPSLAEAFDVSVSQIGYLISLYAAGMVIGGPMLTLFLISLRVPNKQALLWLLALYVGGGSLAASATTYEVMAVARVVTGVAGSACFGVSLAICSDLVPPDARGRASSIVLGGLMLSTVLGVPAATIVDQHFGWRASFWLVVVLAILAALVINLCVPRSRKTKDANLTMELGAFRSGRLWAAFLTSGLIIGATFAAFSYFSPILVEVTGFSRAAIPLLLCLYGLSNVIGNMVVGRFADRYIFSLLTGGLIVLSTTLVVFALFADDRNISIAALVVIGLSGVPLNPAMIARVMRVTAPGPLVNTVHTSVINLGIVVGSWAGGIGIGAGYGLHSPLWIGAGLAVIGLLSIVPARVRQFDAKCY